MNLLREMKVKGHERITFFQDAESGLFCIVAIHDTSLGPALGGVRMWPYSSEADALTDVLRLSEAMTYKASLAGLNIGGGKAVIIGDPRKDKTQALLRSYGRAVEELGGRYITADDVGTTPDDLRVVMEETQWLVGKPLEVGGSGDSAPATGFGVYQGIRAAAQEIWGHSRLHDRIVAIQGFGKVATSLASYLLQDGARLVVAELYPEARELARNRFGAMIVGPDEIYDVEADIFAPCALGGILNETTIPRLKVGVVAGAANNQLLRKEDGERLDALGILYAPDYLINAGGLINLSEEMGHYSEPEAMAKVAKIYETMERIIALAKMERVSLARMADILATRRIEETDEKNMGRPGV